MPLKSMTGYGEATVETDRLVLAIEVKSVNSRFLKISSRIGDEMLHLQNDLEEMVRKHLSRGSIFFTVRFEPTRSADLYEIDAEVLSKYLATVQRLTEESGVSGGVELKDLLLLPGVVRTEEAPILGKAEILPAALKAMERALASVKSMRQEEGRNLEGDLRARGRTLVTLLDKIRQVAPHELEDYKRRLEERVQLLLGERTALVTTEDILKEVALLAERSDITEEIARMDSHVKQFCAALDSELPVGRKLEFITQEMFRESNTMGAKSSSSELSEVVIELKAEVDRIKEQVLNIE